MFNSRWHELPLILTLLRALYLFFDIGKESETFRFYARADDIEYIELTLTNWRIRDMRKIDAVQYV